MGGRKTLNTDPLPPIHTLARDRAHSPGVCPDWKANPQPWGVRTTLRRPSHLARAWRPRFRLQFGYWRYQTGEGGVCGERNGGKLQKVHLLWTNITRRVPGFGSRRPSVIGQDFVPPWAPASLFTWLLVVKRKSANSHFCCLKVIT